jgi:hypothetical protein
MGMQRAGRFIHSIQSEYPPIEIHPLLWRPETFRLTHQLCINNWADITL